MALGDATLYKVKYVTTGVEKSIVGLNSSLSPSNSGGVFSKQYGIHLIKNNVIDLLTTKKGDRVMLPEFGTNLHLAVFEPLDSFLFSEIQFEIATALATYEPRVNIINFEIQEIDATEAFTTTVGPHSTEAVGLTSESQLLISLTVAMKDDVLATETINLAF